MGADEGGPAVDAENLGDGITPRDSTLRGFDRSASPTMKSTSMSTPGSGFSFGRKTLGFWDKPNTVMMRNNVILHNTCGATGRAGVHNAPGPGARPPQGASLGGTMGVGQLLAPRRRCLNTAHPARLRFGCRGLG